MSYQVPLTVATALERIHRHDYVVPAIQREFVWSPQQITNLFDSLLRKYPIGTFLFWNIPAEEAQGFTFYDLMRDYHEIKNRHSQTLVIPPGRSVTAILDGQQRLTSLNIGLNGSYTVKKQGARSSATDAYPTRRMHLDLCFQSDEDDDLGVKYLFKFLTSDEAQAESDGLSHYWVPARIALDIDDGRDVFRYVQERGLAEHQAAYDTLYSLWDSVKQQPSISYFELERQSLDQVLDIFIRVNSGGTVLSKSDLLLSVATAQFKERDAREAIHGLVDDLNAIGQGFSLTKDLVLKAGLLLTDRGDIRFVAVSFTEESMTLLDRAWDEIDRSLRVAVRLLASFGLSAKTLTANSVVLVVADYIHQRRLGSEYISSVTFRDDRERVRSWVIRSLVKAGIWGSNLDTILVRLRRVMRVHGQASFPAAELENELAAMGKPLSIGSQELDELVDSSYQQRRSFLLLSLLYPGVDTRNEFHVDHVFPRARFTETRLRAQGVPVRDIAALHDASNRLANLQLLDGPTNASKNSMMPGEWARNRFPDPTARAAYLAVHDLNGLPESIDGVLAFFAARRQAMKHRLAELLSSSDSPSVPRATVAQGEGPKSADWPPPSAPPGRGRPNQGPSSESQTRRKSFGRTLQGVPNGPIAFKVAGSEYHANLIDGIIVMDDGRAFSSPTAAANAMRSGSHNGWLVWKRDGVSLGELHDSTR
jgi:hypothetical protein